MRLWIPAERKSYKNTAYLLVVEQPLLGFELRTACLPDRCFDQLSHSASYILLFTVSQTVICGSCPISVRGPPVCAPCLVEEELTIVP